MLCLSVDNEDSDQTAQQWQIQNFRGGGFDLNILPYFTYSDRQAWANSVDPDQTPQNAASDQGLHCLPLTRQLDLLKKSTV